MKKIFIQKIEPIVVKDTLSEPFYFSQYEYTERKICIVRIELNNGMVGWGEGYGPGIMVKAGIEYLAPLLLGKNPLQHENLWQLMHRMIYDFARKGIFNSALSALDIALWDLKGKMLQLPVSILLGGRKREQVQAYATGLYFTHIGNMQQNLAEEATKYKKNGFNALKMKVGLGIAKDIENIRAVRLAIGEKMELMVDANHAYGLREAKQLILQMQEYQIKWFEEPLLNEDQKGYQELRKFSPIPIAAGECEHLKYGAFEMMSNGCVDIFQPDTGACGGITEVKNIMTLAQVYHVNMTTHTWGTGIVIAANLHLMSNLDIAPQRLVQHNPIMELDCSPNRLRDEILMVKLEMKDGYLNVPNAPGLGIEINEDKLSEFIDNS